MEIQPMLEQIFNNDYPGTERFIADVIEPIFGNEIEYINDDLAEREEYTEKAKKAGIKHIRYIGDMTEKNYNADNIALLDITLDDSKNIERSRVNVQQLIRSIMDYRQHLMIVFHYEDVTNKQWRFSYAYKGDSLRDTTSAKRYTYVFGKGYRGRTAAERFQKLAGSQRNNEDFEEAFSVSALSDEFFDLYRAYYAAFVEYIAGEKYTDEKKLNAIIWKWDWLKKDESDQFTTTFDDNAKEVRDYIKKMFGRIVFLYFLQRKGWLYDSEGVADPRYMRHLFDGAGELKDTFLDDVLELLFFYVLNTKPEQRVAEASLANKDITILPGWAKIPFLNGGLFSQDDIDPKRCVFPAVYFDKLFEFLDSYNFTIDENDPEDAEVGIDPEMLGRIFENLLEDNKDKGAYYTPKEIVDYMCRESIIAYLQVNPKYYTQDKARKFIETLNIDILNEDERKEIEKRLISVKICDPAIGSGAFPMGIVNLLAKAFIVLRTYSSIDQAKMKRYIMQNSIYGVDIEQGAVDIARLRFWLAMVVEENEPQPLPNLHFKIMQGNSLVESYKGLDLSSLMKPESGRLDYITDERRKQLRSSLAYFFNESDHEKRNKHLVEIKNIVTNMVYNADSNINLTELDCSANDQFFMWHTWFADVFDNGGFDIVIGNPPYIDSETMTNSQPELRNLYARLFKFAKGNWDIYIIFYELGLSLLSSKGILSYIVPNKWLSIGYGKALRTNTYKKISTICDCRGVKVFEAGNEPIISIMKNSLADTVTIGRIKEGRNIEHVAQLNKTLIDSDNIGMCISHHIELIAKIKSNKETVSKLADIENPFTTGEAYDLIPLISENKDAKDYRLINTGTIDPYISFWGRSKTAYLKNKYSFPQIDKTKFKSIFPRRVRQVESPKIIISGMRHFESFFDSNGDYLAGKSTIIALSPKKEDSLYVLQGIFNSRLMKFYIYEAFSTLGIGGGINFSKDLVANLPVELYHDFSPIITLVKSIMATKENDPLSDTFILENQIDHIVYHLYDLTYDEVLIVDPETPITREEYESFKL